MAISYQYGGVGEEDPYDTEVATERDSDLIRMSPRELKKHEFENTMATSYVRGAELTEEQCALDFVWYPRTEGIEGHILKFLLGDPADNLEDTTAYTHTYKSDDTLLSFTYLDGDENLTEIPYTGHVMQNLEMASSAGGLFTFRATSYGNKAAAANSINTPTLSALATLRHADLTLKVDTVDKSAFVGSVAVRINNNPEQGKVTAGSTSLQNMPRHQKRVVEWVIELPYYDSALKTAYDAGDTVDLDVQWDGAIIEAAYAYYLQLYSSKVVLTNYEYPKDGRDKSTHRVTGQAIWDSVDASEIVAVLENTIASY